jgi:hypothetical protein
MTMPENKNIDAWKKVLANPVLRLSCGALFISATAAIFMREIPYFTALGSTTMIASLVLLSIAWVAYLAKDGVRFFPKAQDGKLHNAESWKERVPNLGSAPPFLPPVPDAQGPESDSYRRLQSAEASLKARIFGHSSTENKTERIERQKKTMRTAGISCAILFLISLGLQYFL